MRQELLVGIITEDGCVQLEDGRKFYIPSRGTDKEGYPEVLMDAKSVGGDGWMYRQSIKPYIGMKCQFILNEGTSYGFDFNVIA